MRETVLDMGATSRFYLTHTTLIKILFSLDENLCQNQHLLVCSHHEMHNKLFLGIHCTLCFLSAHMIVPDRRSGFHSDTRDPKYGFVSVNTKVRTREPKTP